MPDNAKLASRLQNDNLPPLEILAARIGALEILVQNLMVGEFMKEQQPVDRASLAIKRARMQLDSVQSRDGGANMSEIRATQMCFLEMLEVVRETVQQLERRSGRKPEARNGRFAGK